MWRSIASSSCIATSCDNAHENADLDVTISIDWSPDYISDDTEATVTIHESIDAGRISAECKSGVLTVHLPKVEAVKPRQIAVRGQ